MYYIYKRIIITLLKSMLKNIYEVDNIRKEFKNIKYTVYSYLSLYFLKPSKNSYSCILIK